MKKISEIIRGRRTELDLKQADVARAVGVGSPDYISMLESGNRQLDLDRVPALAKVLKLDPRELTSLALLEQFPIAAAALGGRLSRRASEESKTDEISIMLEQLDPLSRKTVKSLVSRMIDLARSKKEY